MNSNVVLILAIVFSGPLYYAFYRIVFHRGMKWKMTHALWIPIAVLIYGVITLFLDQRIKDPSSWGWIESIPVFMNFILLVIAVLIFLMCYTAFSFWDERHKKQIRVPSVKD